MRRMTADHFLVGLFKTLQERGVSTLNVRTTRVDAALHAAFEKLRSDADELGLDLRFRVTLNLHGESPAMREALARAAMRDEVSLDNPEYTDVRFKVANLEAVEWSSLPGGEALYQRLANAFLDRYQRGVAA